MSSGQQNWGWFGQDNLGPIQHLQDILLGKQELLEEEACEE